MLEEITPVILTFNESANIDRTLAGLHWAKKVLVVDSFSTDDTVEIAMRHENVEVHRRNFDTHANQWSFALAQTGITTEWILALDADYVVSEELKAEIAGLRPDDEVSGFRTRFRYCVLGRPLRGSVYPPVTTLYRRKRARYEQDGHTQRVRIEGRIDSLRHPIRHDDRKPLARWLSSQERYMTLEAAHIAGKPLASLAPADALRRLIVVAPFLMFLHCAFVRGNVLDGRAGLYYALQRTLAECLLSLRLLEATLGHGAHTPPVPTTDQAKRGD